MEKSGSIFGIVSVTLLLFASTRNGVMCLTMQNWKDDAVRNNGVCSWGSTGNGMCDITDFQCFNGKCIAGRLYCDNSDDCGDNSDEKFCESEFFWSPSCPRGMIRCKGTHKCIPDGWLCNDVQECDDGSDESRCDSGVNKKNDIRMKAIQWLKEQKNSNSHTEMWKSTVDKTAVALYLASGFPSRLSMDIEKEMAYEISIQLLSRLSRRKLRDIPSSDLASYVNAFLVTCLDPRKFHGMDIVKELRSRMERPSYTNPYVLLSLCNAGDTITESDQLKLLDAFNIQRLLMWKGVQALVVMALACASQQPGNGISPQVLRRLVDDLKRHQHRNGTIDNLQTTALVMQALMSVESDSDPYNFIDFDENKAVEQILAMQKTDGSFGSLMKTYYVLPVLSCKSLVNISSDHCDYSSRDEISALQDLVNRDGPKIQVQYSLWIGKDRDLERTLMLRIPTNTSFFEMMEMTAEIDFRYRFEYVVRDRKLYVSSLSGLLNDPESEKFWLLYTIDDGKPSFVQESTSDLILKDKEHYVMWYRSGPWHG